MRSSRLLATAASAALVLALPTAASAQTVDCSVEGSGSAAGLPAECVEEEEPDVLGVVDERPDEPISPAPVPETVPDAAPEAAPETLTATGVDSDVLALGAGAAIALGGAALFLSRRRAHADLDA